AVDGVQHHLALGGGRVLLPEVLPQPEGDGGQVQAAVPAAAVGHRVVAVLTCVVGHELTVSGVTARAREAQPAAGSTRSRMASGTWASASRDSGASSPLMSVMT